MGALQAERDADLDMRALSDVRASSAGQLDTLDAKVSALLPSRTSLPVPQSAPPSPLCA